MPESPWPQFSPSLPLDLIKINNIDIQELCLSCCALMCPMCRCCHTPGLDSKDYLMAWSVKVTWDSRLNNAASSIIIIIVIM